ncbi:flavin reductase (DIM6/NTAB) family NADH-FMN oxidoreductase RutF [Lachnotalea glycerini]|jgi:flavin reductase (DIM6/NTAB) family NADH-FMN oxidoreductase RutF|uniref:Flavin reductase (DIM6/NTAB) family NADH-FMN oxidoreductase RutF n=1 Tax=Lachnotalea glycerini TaxID=1763509 RepID=A0A318EUC4_9FIRM|nr:flavin reductase family protein [Lachnotalea glycerini]OYP54771.1 flavin reductase [Lachnotalea glycerini]PXV91800.1 flavin reductase (DIM6/NTAB) family NADH-FMN oxidoreductase RutF [Lachnotalea glycerini]RDY31225.1 flavin reductase family protein [Lachnotalea glycerini]
MGKQVWKPGNMLYPLPVVMVSCADKNGKTNIITIAWTGTICSNPPMLYISVRPERSSYSMIKETGEFVVNLTTKSLSKATDYCGVRSGRDVDKFKEMKLTRGKAEKLTFAPIIMESPVSLECKVVEVKELGSHHMFIAEVLAVDVDESYMDNKGKFRLSSSDLIVYSHGDYYNLKEKLGTFGYSVKKKGKKQKVNSKQNIQLKKKNLTWVNANSHKKGDKK